MTQHNREELHVLWHRHLSPVCYLSETPNHLKKQCQTPKNYPLHLNKTHVRPQKPNFTRKRLHAWQTCNIGSWPQSGQTKWEDTEQYASRASKTSRTFDLVILDPEINLTEIWKMEIGLFTHMHVHTDSSQHELWEMNTKIFLILKNTDKIWKMTNYHYDGIGQHYVTLKAMLKSLLLTPLRNIYYSKRKIQWGCWH